MLDQTIPCDDFVLVCDGPLTPELDAVIEHFDGENPSLFNVIRLEKNVGIGASANAGLMQCKNDLVAKMDSDDIARVQRCEKQLEAFRKNPQLSIVSGQLVEFIRDTSNIVGERSVPLEHDDILKFAKHRSPFNNQTVMYRKQAIDAVDGYSPLRRCEDYDLYARMLHKGFLSMNIPDILVDYRLSDDTYKRRGAWTNFKDFYHVHLKLYRSGFSGLADFILPYCGQLILSLMPRSLKNFLYTRMLRAR